LLKLPHVGPPVAMTYQVQTLSDRMNSVDSERMAGELEGMLQARFRPLCSF
jgi:hypothetical protein